MLLRENINEKQHVTKGSALSQQVSTPQELVEERAKGAI